MNNVRYLREKIAKIIFDQNLLFILFSTIKTHKLKIHMPLPLHRKVMNVSKIPRVKIFFRIL